MENEINFEQELYKHFGRVKDFTLGMRIAKWFYDMGKNSQEPVSEDLEEEVHKISNQIMNSENETYSKSFIASQVDYIARHFANWQKQQMMKDAVEGIVQTNSMSGNTVVVHLDWRYKAGDKVKIVVIRSEED